MAMQKVCPKCRAAAPLQAGFCAQCGHTFPKVPPRHIPPRPMPFRHVFLSGAAAALVIGAVVSAVLYLSGAMPPMNGSGDPSAAAARVSIVWTSQTPYQLEGVLTNTGNVPVKGLYLAAHVYDPVHRSGFYVGNQVRFLPPHRVTRVVGRPPDYMTPEGIVTNDSVIESDVLAPGQQAHLLFFGLSYEALRGLRVYVLRTVNGKTEEIPVRYTEEVSPQ